MKRLSHRFALLAVLLLVPVALVIGAEQLKPQGWVFPTVKLQAVPAAPSLLQTPAGVAGDFAAAKAAPTVEFAILPGQWKDGGLWSNWGDSLCGGDGAFYCSIGEHFAPYGNALVYRVDPTSKEVKMVVDFNEVVKGPKTDYAPGKIHCPLMDGGDGWMYFIGYRGSGAGLNDEHHYMGDPMLRYEYATGKAEQVSIPAAYYSVPSSVIVTSKTKKLMYGLGGGGAVRTPNSTFFVYDMAAKKTIFMGGPAPDECRSILVAPDGTAYYSTGRTAAKAAKDGQPAEPAKGGAFAKYDPKTNEVIVTDLKVPENGTMRAASRCNADGVAYCITHDGLVFSFDTKTEKITPITRTFEPPCPLYTAVCKLSPDDRFLYVVPGSHGGGKVAGTPVVQIDVKTGKRKVIAFLQQYMRDQTKYRCGGSFGTALSADGSQLFICFNGRDLGNPKVSWQSNEDLDFDQVAVVVLTIPESERK